MNKEDTYKRVIKKMIEERQAIQHELDKVLELLNELKETLEERGVI